MRTDCINLVLAAVLIGIVGGLQQARAVDVRQVCVADDGLYCFDARDLSLRWQQPRDSSANVVVAAGNITLASGSGGLTAYSADGRKLWQRTDFGATFDPRVAGDAVFVGSIGGDVARLRLQSGDVVWRRQLSGWAYSPALLGNTVVTGGSAGELHAFDRDTGQPRWMRDLGQELVYQPIEVSASRVVATTFDGRVVAFDSKGAPVWEKRFSVPAGTPVVRGDRLYSSLFDGRLIVLNAADGELVWQQQFEQRVKLAGLAEGIVVFDVDRVVAFDGRNNAFWRRDFNEEVLAVLPLEQRDIVVFFRRAAAIPAAQRLRLSAFD